MDLLRCKIVSFDIYASFKGKTISQSGNCSNCGSHELLTFVQKHSSAPKVGWRFCSSCLHDFLRMPETRR